MTDRYRDHLASDEWQRTCKLALERARWRCQSPSCRLASLRGYTDDDLHELGFDYRLNVHHLSLERLGRELPDDVIVLCEECRPSGQDRHAIGNVLSNVLSRMVPP